MTRRTYDEDPRWSYETWNRSGGDNPFILYRVYRYQFNETPWSRLRLPYATIEVTPDHPRDHGPEGYDINGDTQGHWRLAHDAPFEVNGRNVVEWARESAHRGRVKIKVIIERVDWITRVNKVTLEASFTDRRTAMLFKLAFGGL